MEQAPRPTGALYGFNVNGSVGTTTAGAPGAWTVKGTGTGIGGTADKFQFAQQNRTGNFDVKVKLASLTSGGTAGLVVRGDVSGGNSEVAILFSGGKVTFGSRATFGATYAGKQVGTGSAGNLWLRLKRVGNVYTAYFGTNGTTWTTAGSVTISSLAATLKLGLATYGTATTSATAGFTGLAG